jgi:NADP-dependent 3-hydroxy acid dehydrogenase YdfG
VNVSSVTGRRVGAGGGIYQMTKHGVGAFSEALRQEPSRTLIVYIVTRPRHVAGNEVPARPTKQVR